MEQKHTPGPWAACASNASTLRHPTVLSDAGGVAIATWAGSEKLTDANARLIASAPELLAALQELYSAVDSGRIFRQVAAMEIARIAIAKATGEAA